MGYYLVTKGWNPVNRGNISDVMWNQPYTKRQKNICYHSYVKSKNQPQRSKEYRMCLWMSRNREEEGMMNDKSTRTMSQVGELSSGVLLHSMVAIVNKLIIYISK